MPVNKTTKKALLGGVAGLATFLAIRRFLAKNKNSDKPPSGNLMLDEAMYRPVCLKEDKYLSDDCMSLDEAQKIAREHQIEYKHKVNWERC